MNETEKRQAAKTLERKSIPVTECGCLIWLGGVMQKGYGVLSINGRSYRTHRAAYEVWRGPIPDGIQVLHTCDTPCCINPEHLFLGTAGDNHIDMQSKGRSNYFGGVSLPRKTIDEIKSSKEGDTALAKKYNVARSTIWRLRTGKRRKTIQP